MGLRSQPGREGGAGVHLEAEGGQLCSWVPQVSFPLVLVSWNNSVEHSRLQKTHDGRNFIWGVLTGGPSGVYWLGRSNSVVRLILASLKDPLYHRKSLLRARSSSCQQESSSQDSGRNAQPKLPPCTWPCLQPLLEAVPSTSPACPHACSVW